MSGSKPGAERPRDDDLEGAPPSQSAPISDAADDAPFSGVLPWEVGDVYRCGWHAMRRAWFVLLPAGALAGIGGSELPTELALYVPMSDDATTHAWVAWGLGWFVHAWAQTGLVRIALSVGRGTGARLRDFFFGPRLGSSIVGVLLLAGSLGAPGLLVGEVVDRLAIGVPYAPWLVVFFVQCWLVSSLALVPFAVVDGHAGPLGAFTRSLRLTRGKRLHIFLATLPGTAFGLGPLTIDFPGANALFWMLLMPLMATAIAIIFLRSTGHALRRGLPHPDGLGPAAYREIPASF